MTEGTTGLDLDAIEARARAATPGPWHMAGDDNPAIRHYVGGYRFTVAMVRSWDRIPENAAHIAGMDPTTTLDIVAEMRRLRRLEEALREELAGALRYAETLKMDLAGARDMEAKAESYAACSREEARLWRALAKAYADADEFPRLSQTWCAARERIDATRRALAKAGIDPDAT